MKTHFHLNKVENFVGFSLNIAGEGEMVKVLTRAALTSDEDDFYNYIEQISRHYLSKIGTTANNVHQLLILIHEDLSANIFINNIQIFLEILPTHALGRGEIVTHRDIADINKLKIIGIDINETDKFIICIKIGWKFALLFDLDRREKLNIDNIWIKLGELYRYLAFHYIYKVLESEEHFDEMTKDGWFPFIELIGGEEYKLLNEAYKHKRFRASTVDSVIKTFDINRMEKITDRWWNKDIFSEKKTILMAGINSFLRGDDEGNITCIKTLLPEIEGIIRIKYFSETGKGKNEQIDRLLKFIVEKGKTKFGSDYSLLLPLHFIKFLKKEIFTGFDLRKGDIRLTRHSSSHGVVKAKDYTKMKALQMILIIDQLSFYM